jgi:hypothetical protein
MNVIGIGISPDKLCDAAIPKRYVVPNEFAYSPSIFRNTATGNQTYKERLK